MKNIVKSFDYKNLHIALVTACLKSFSIKAEEFEHSPEYEEWIEETGGRDEDRSFYYEKWERRVRQMRTQ